MTRFASHGFYKNLRAYAERAGLKDVTPHVLRHSAAKLRRDTGASSEAVDSLLGHRNLATTSRYLARVEVFTPSGDYVAQWKIASPHGIAFDSAGRAYVTNFSGITRVVLGA